MIFRGLLTPLGADRTVSAALEVNPVSSWARFSPKGSRRYSYAAPPPRAATGTSVRAERSRAPHYPPLAVRRGGEHLFVFSMR